MSDPFADIVGADPFADIVRPARSSPGWSLPMPVRDVARGIASVPGDLAALHGFVTGNEGSQQIARWWEENVATPIAPQARFDQEPLRAALQFGGPALVPVGPAAQAVSLPFRAGARLLPATVQNSSKAQWLGSAAMNVAEVLLPGTSRWTLPRVGANAAVGTGVGAGVEEVQDQARANRATREAAARDPFADIVGSGGNDGGSGQQSQAPAADRSTAEIINDYLPYVAAGLTAVGVGAAVRGANQANRIAAANTGSMVESGTPAALTPQVGLLERIEAGLFDRFQVLRNRFDEEVRAGRMTREQADEVVNTVVMRSNEAQSSDILREVMETGITPDGRTFEPPRRLMNDLAALRDADPDAFKRFNDLMAAADEWDVRQHNITNGIWMSGQPGVARRNALYDQDDAALKRMIADGRRSPEIAAMEARYRSINENLLDYAVRNGIWTPAEAAAIRAAGPNYMHRLVTEMKYERSNVPGLEPIKQGTELNSPITKRDRGEEAGPLRMSDPIMSMEDGIRQTLDFVRRNEAVRLVADNLRQLGARNVRGIGRVIPDGPGAQARQGYVGLKFRDNGKRWMLEIEPTMAAALMPYPRVFIPLLNGLRMLEQRFTTGLPALILGNMQAPMSAAMGTMSALINAPKNMRVGLVDKYLHQVSGGRINLRAMKLIDPTFALQVLAAPARDIIDHSKLVLAQSLERSIAHNSGWVDMLGRANVQHYANKAFDAYINSDLHRMRRDGLLAQGIAYAAEGGSGPSYSTRLTNLAQIAPEYAAGIPYSGNAAAISAAFRSPQQLKEYITRNAVITGAQPGFRHLARGYANMSKVLDLLANAPQSALYRANKRAMANAPMTLIGQARTITGDPSQYGGFGAVQAILSMIPFGNIAMQNTHQALRAMRRDPALFATSLTTLGVAVALTQISSAINADEWAIENGLEPSNVAHLMTQDARDGAASMRVYWPNVPPELAPRLPIEQSFAPAFSLIRGWLQAGFDLENPEFYTGRYTGLRDSIHRLIEDGDEARTWAAVGLMGGDVPMLGALDAAARIATGHSIDNAMSFASRDAQQRITKVQDAPGFENTQLNNDVFDRHTAAVLEGAGGFGGQAILDLIRTYVMAGRHPGGDQLGAAAEQYRLNLTGGFRMFGPAMQGQEPRRRMNDMVGEQVRDMEAKMETFRANLPQVRSEGNTIGGMRTQREPEFGGGRVALPPDIRPVVEAFNARYNSLRAVRDQRKVVQDNIRALASSPQMRANPEELRRRTNEGIAEVRRLNAIIYDATTNLESELSAQHGRRIRVIHLDPLRGLDQFAPMR